MKPTDKHPSIDDFITQVTGIDRKGSIERNKCVFCKKDVVTTDFRDTISLKEYTISGICQQCQDEVFGT